MSKRLALGIAGTALALSTIGTTAAEFTDTPAAGSGQFSAAVVPTVTNLRCTGSSLLTSRALWDPVAGATGYRVTHSGGTVDLAGNETSYSLTSLGLPATISVSVIKDSWTSVPVTGTFAVVALVCVRVA